jgi:hypothetical protein
MWQGGLAAGKPSVPWYQIHVRGIPGWRACRRPQASDDTGIAPRERRVRMARGCVRMVIGVESRRRADTCGGAWRPPRSGA